MTRFIRSSVLLVLGFSLANCSIGFDRQWQKAAADAHGSRPGNLSGPWVGTWRSESNGHRGRLRAIATQVAPSAGAPAAYEFHYEATWKSVLSACITARHEVTAVKPGAGRPLVLSGEKNLGLLGGVYRFTGTASPAEFRADYRSEHDHGVFEMKRPEAAP